jgi:hypothetical protein
MRFEMTIINLKRQIITDNDGNPVGIILPLDEYDRIKKLLNSKNREVEEEDKLRLIKKAANDPLFLADLEETMSVYQQVDTEWWERKE